MSRLLSTRLDTASERSVTSVTLSRVLHFSNLPGLRTVRSARPIVLSQQASRLRRPQAVRASWNGSNDRPARQPLTRPVSLPSASSRSGRRVVRSGQVRLVILALALLVGLLPTAPAQTTHAASNVAMPFAGGTAVKIIQGYNGGTHQGRSQYGLDLVVADGATADADVVSPVDGSVTYAQSSGNGCIAVALTDGSYTVMMCHVALSRPFKGGEAVTRGQSLGTVGKAGTVGNNGVAHVHLELHKGNRLSSPVPFAEPDGLPLEGIALPASSTTAVIAKREPIVSSNGRGGGAATTMAQSTPRTQQMSARAEPAPLAAASLPSTVRSVQPAASSPAATTATRKAIVNGTESCLKVRKQPSSDAAVVTCLKEGAEVALKPLATGADPKWRQTDQGWVSSEFLKRSQAVVTGTSACLNVREAPKASAAKLGCLPDGTAVTIAEGPTTADGF